MPIASNSRILLAGAGFTHNFGAPLAQGMWDLIFNNPEVQACERIKELLQGNLDFESVYHQVIEGDYDEHEKRVAMNAVNAAYGRLDETVRSFSVTSNTSPYALGRRKLNNLIDSFSGNDASGFYFTLNQDLFIERQYPNDGLLNIPCIPGVERHRDWFTIHFDHPLSDADRRYLPSQEELDARKEQLLEGSNFFYVKLHGSQDWVRSAGQSAMVIGYAKGEQIQTEPLLSWYFDIFQAVLSQDQRRLLVIGYGFRDAHVNQIIANAARRNGLRIYIIAPGDPARFRDRLLTQQDGQTLWEAVAAYIRGSLQDLFPVNGTETAAYRELCYVYFDGEKLT